MELLYWKIMAWNRLDSQFLLLALALPLLFAAMPAAAQDGVRGRQLYETHCSDCHYQRVHQRERDKSLVRSMEDLRGQVARWAPQTRRPLSSQDLADIVDYLNGSYYRLEK